MQIPDHDPDMIHAKIVCLESQLDLLNSELAIVEGMVALLAEIVE